ncbi:MAG: Uma2 family endonuclease [Maioricimonas sp. JB049]
MSTAVPDKLMTEAEFLALPGDEILDRMLIRGRLWQNPATHRDRWGNSTEARIAALLDRWLETQPEPRGEIYSGEAGVRLRRDPATIVGVDVCYVSAEVASRDSDETMLIDGPPVLAVEILSPSDRQDEIASKVDEYLAAGVSLVWIVDPHFRTVVVHQPEQPPRMFAGEDEISADPHLPGFVTSVTRLFQR